MDIKINFDTTNFDNIVLFAFNICQEMSNALRKYYWVKRNYEQWDNEYFDKLCDFLNEDIAPGDLMIRIQAVSATKNQAISQFDRHYKFYVEPRIKGGHVNEAEKETELKSSCSFVNINEFIEHVKQKESKIKSKLQPKELKPEKIDLKSKLKSENYNPKKTLDSIHIIK